MRSYVNRLSQKVSKLSKEQLSTLLSGIIEENNTLYSIIDSISAGLMITDNNFVIQQTNTIVESLLSFKYHSDSAKISDYAIWEILEDEDIAAYLKKCAEKDITNGNEDFSVMTTGGTVRFVNITMSPFMYNNVLSGRIFIVRDITEQKNQQIRLHRMENLANLTNLAAGMAHEIKNPLGAISIHIQLIKKALEKARKNNDILPPKKFVEDHIDVVTYEIENLNNLVMDFLMAVRPINATLELKDPAKVIENMVDFIKPEFNRDKIKVSYKIPEVSKRIMLDEKLFREIFINLAQNSLAAIKTKQEDSKEEGKFLIECACTENKYVIRVTDNGCGMSSETISKIFEPYYTTKANGTGLGMTMVYKIVKEFSGEIQVESEQGVGTSFTLIFPIPQKDKKLITETKNK